MEKFYSIENNYAKIILKENIYPMVVVEKTLSNFLGEVIIKIEEEQSDIIVYLAKQNPKVDLKKIVERFYNELLREALRYNISLETKNLRELIVGRALYTTCIDLNEQDNLSENNKERINSQTNIEKISEEEFNLEDIAVNWFDINNSSEDKIC